MVGSGVSRLGLQLVVEPDFTEFTRAIIRFSPDSPYQSDCELNRVESNDDLAAYIDRFELPTANELLIFKGKGIVAEPSRPTVKRERLLESAPWERIRLGTSLISSNEEKEVPLVRNKNSKVDEVDVVSQGSESCHFDCWEEVPTVHVPQALPLVL
ncbi:hypothetical protein LWI29_011083 [Acer saccharum]|uniref:Uncharacterized protein n=1 Tax=Acer saccharum TaxID=4024 RepID=A0AA39USX3_ACESA|nr:hypothetical protein LWI29_011083 [Acer saccharum]